jgi:hypothetical protein
MYLHILPWAPHTYFIVLTSVTHPRKFLLVVLETGKAKDLSAPLHSKQHGCNILKLPGSPVNMRVPKWSTLELRRQHLPETTSILCPDHNSENHSLCLHSVNTSNVIYFILNHTSHPFTRLPQMHQIFKNTASVTPTTENCDQASNQIKAASLCSIHPLPHTPSWHSA